jgi:transketolase
MGDQVGVAVSGTLYYVPFNEFERIRALGVSAIETTRIFAALCRINTLYMIARAGSGHIGSSFSSMDIMSWLQLNELRTPLEGDPTSPSDIFFSSKGHDAPGLYSTWIGMGKLDFDLIHQLRRLNGLPGHPDISTPNVVTNTGSLGMGVSKAKGMIVANRLLKQPGNVYVLTGDGELQEGQFWESLVSAANNKLHELTVIIDHNKLQSDTLVSKVSDLGNLEAKLAAFGWHVSRCDGNDLAAFAQTIAVNKLVTDKPKVIIADTIKGKGVSFMEHTSLDSDVEFYKFHSGAPTDDAYVKAAQELIETANALLATVGAEKLELERVQRPAAVVPENTQRLVVAYSNALMEQARMNPNIVALDADLILDTGLIPFQKEFPNRLIECGIAEQDMISQAGGIALRGMLPIAHSFACFLSARPNEQIYNNGTEQTKIIYVGSLAGLIPAGPGHSHQSLRDISLMANIPNLLVVEPSCEQEVGMLLEWAVSQSDLSTYLRLVSAPIEINFELPNNYKLLKGTGVTLRDGQDVVIISHGPLSLTNAITAAKKLEGSHRITCEVINLPWLNFVDDEWLFNLLARHSSVFILDNHFKTGGQGQFLGAKIAEIAKSKVNIVSVGLVGMPMSGGTDEIMQHHALDSGSIERAILCQLGHCKTT